MTAQTAFESNVDLFIKSGDLGDIAILKVEMKSLLYKKGQTPVVRARLKMNEC